jgi:hypothetical protein
MFDEPISSARLMLGVKFILFLKHVVTRKTRQSLSEVIFYVHVSNCEQSALGVSFVTLVNSSDSFCVLQGLENAQARSEQCAEV